MSTFDKMVLLPKNIYVDIKNQIEEEEKAVHSLKKQIESLKEQINQNDESKNTQQISDSDENKKNDQDIVKDTSSANEDITSAENEKHTDSQDKHENETKIESNHESIENEEGSRKDDIDDKGNDNKLDTSTTFQPKLKLSVQNADEDGGTVKNVFTCPTCNKEFDSSEELKSHIKNLHAKSFECKFCDKKFESMNKLNKHITFNHERTPERQSTRIRNQKRLKEDVLSDSVESETERDNKRAKVDDIKSSNAKRKRTNENDTIQGNFSKKGRFDCPICGKQFSSLLDLANHEVSHNDLKRKRTDESSKGQSNTKKKRSN